SPRSSSQSAYTSLGASSARAATTAASSSRSPGSSSGVIGLRFATASPSPGDPVLAHPGPEHLGHRHRPVRLLVVLQDRYQRPRAGHRGAVERVGELRPLLPRGLVANVQPPRLEVGAVARAGHLAVLPGLATARHPGFEVIFAISRTAQIASAG